MPDQRIPWNDLATITHAQGVVSVQADCTHEVALMLMTDRAAMTDRRIVDIADAVIHHQLWFDPARATDHPHAPALARVT